MSSARRKRAKHEKKERASKRLRAYLNLTSLSSLKDMRENAPSVEAYLNLSEFTCRLDKSSKEPFFVVIYRRIVRSGKFAFSIFNGQGVLVHRESGFISFKECKKEGDTQRTIFESGYGAVPEDNSVSDTFH